MKFYDLQDVFQDAKNASKSFEVFKQYFQECSDANLDVISCDKNMKLNYPIFKEIMNIPYIKTIFEHPNLAFFNKEIVASMIKDTRSDVKIDYSINFDTNTATYVYKYFKNGKDSVPNNFIDTLRFILDNNLNIDPMFYVLENASKGENSDSFYENLISLKKLMTCDMNHYNKTKEIKSIFSDDEVAKRAEEDLKILQSEHIDIIKFMKQAHLVMKIILSAIVISRFKYKTNLKNQLVYLLSFMNNELQAIYLRELSVALTYFEKKNIKIFNVLNNRSSFDVLLENIDNIAWDFTLVRTLEMNFSLKLIPESDFFIPFIYTHDKGLLEVIEMFYCKDLLIFHNEKKVIPIPCNSIMPKIRKNKLEKYFTEEALLSRINNQPDDYDQILNKLNNEMKVLFKF